MSMKNHGFEGICFIVTPKLIDDILNQKTKLNLETIANYCQKKVDCLNSENVLDYLGDVDNDFFDIKLSSLDCDNYLESVNLFDLETGKCDFSQSLVVDDILAKNLFYNYGLFDKPYNNKEELISTIKENINWLPDDFDFSKSIALVIGNYFS